MYHSKCKSVNQENYKNKNTVEIRKYIVVLIHNVVWIEWKFSKKNIFKKVNVFMIV